MTTQFDEVKTGPRYQPGDRDTKILKTVNEAIEEARRWHTSFARKVERRYDAYRGMSPENTPRSWRSQMHPPHLINIVEGMLASMEEGEPAWEVYPRILPGTSAQEAAAEADKAKLNEYLIADQMRVDDFAGKQGPFMLQDLVAGFSPGKAFWLVEEKNRRFLDQQPEMIYDQFGGSIDVAMKLDEYQETILYKDQPTFEVRDVRDILFPESATSIEKCPWILDRTFITWDTLDRMEQLGIYKNTRYIKETRYDSTQGGPDVVADREQRLRNIDRTRGLVEVIEYWTDETVWTVANRSVVIRDAPNPFWHGRKPFFTSCAIPDMFMIPGISVIEGLAQLQDMLWTLTNMRLDATRMLGNVITVIRSNIDNADDFEWEPNAQWLVDGPPEESVKTLDINPAVAQISLQAEGLLRGDIQSIMGGLPNFANAQSSTVDPKTATGISIVTNIAQAVIQRRKNQHVRAFGKLATMFLELNQQFLREKRTVEILGPGAARRYEEVEPLHTQGHYTCQVKYTGDSLMRQEDRAEKQALLTTAIQSAPIMAQSGTPLDLVRFWEKYLESYGEHEFQTFFKAPSPAPAAAPGGPGLPPGGTPPGADVLMEDMAGGGSPGGATNTALAAGPTSPSSDISMSPAAAQQRALASTGAGRSA